MALLHETLKQLVDAAISPILTGGAFDANDSAQTDWGGWDWAVGQGLVPDGVTLTGHARLRWRSSSAFQSEHPALGAEREFLEVYLCDDETQGYVNIDAAIKPLKDALHKQLIASDDRALAYCLFALVSDELQAEEYHMKPMKLMRFGLTHIRS